MPVCPRVSLRMPLGFWMLSLWTLQSWICASPHIPGASKPPKPKARFSHQGRIFRLQILRRGGQRWPNLQLWIMSFAGLTQNIQSISGKYLKHLGEHLHISLSPVFIFSFLLSPGPWFTLLICLSSWWHGYYLGKQTLILSAMRLCASKLS